MTDFFIDVCEGKVRAVKSWLEKGADVNAPDKNGNYAIHLAAEKGFRGVCKVLLDAGARTNQKNKNDGWTALHLAAIEGHIDVLRMLLAHGANPIIRDKEGYTPEYYADRFHNFECVNVIQEHKPQKSDSASTVTSDTSDTLTDDSDEDESSMMNWVIYGNVNDQPKAFKRSRSKLKAAKSDATIYEEFSKSSRPIPKSDRSNIRIPGLTTVPDSEHTNLHNSGNSKPDVRSREVQPPSRRITVSSGGSSPPSLQKERHKVSYMKTYICIDDVRLAIPGLEGVSVPLDLFNTSSATIPDDLEDLDMDRDVSQSSESEKAFLLKRLQSLVEGENKYKENILKGKQSELKMKESQQQQETRNLEYNYEENMKKLQYDQRLEKKRLETIQQQEEDRIQEEIDKLERELKSLSSSYLLVSTLLNPEPVKDKGPFQSLDIEDDISCCSCNTLLVPPNKIYQCNNGDLFCIGCRGKAICPACGVYLTQTIRNLRYKLCLFYRVEMKQLIVPNKK